MKRTLPKHNTKYKTDPYQIRALSGKHELIKPLKVVEENLVTRSEVYLMDRISKA